ncbi:MAG TPA: imidazolonepropionase [Candidatus Aminicenantes bacterium]|nr:imidazolonepropionase [Candidatus Aminicenantes bacterium]HRY65069.1 imidazolonepropionase [Candidatus Aminicenantes bacterium]HRZ71982.1 imidazolonepropionase [Candidatus Aminicenantes bacterium]
MISADLVVAGCRELVTCAGALPKRGPEMRRIGAVENGWVASSGGTIVFAGTEEEFQAGVAPAPGAVTIDARGFVALPGFVDAHTHLPFAGDRAREFGLRIQGWTYQQLAERGMGIQTTVKATRAASLDDILALTLKRLDRMLLTGTTTAEAKSGYGLNLEDELKQLEALRQADILHPVDVVPTFMGAHDIAPEYRDRRGEYVRLLVETLIPEVGRRGLAEFFDVFCEPSAFSLEETRTLAAAAKAAGFKIKVHADEFVSLGGAELAAEAGAVSAEHLIAVSEEGISRLAAGDTAAILLPGVSFFLMMDKRAPARRLVDAGAAVALASDFNPGSSHICSMPFVLQLGVFTLGLTVEEAICACTANAAFAIRRHGAVGSLEPGKKMDLLLCDVPGHVSLAYEAGRNPVRTVIKNGKVVVEDGRRVAAR